MKLKLVLAAIGALLIAGGTAAVVTLREPTHPHRVLAPDPHRKGLDRTMSPLAALYTAPEGKTPCESAYNAFRAEIDTAKAMSLRSHIIKLADREPFFARCEELSKEAQACMVPKYMAQHRQACDRVKPPADVLKQMIDAKADGSDDSESLP